MIEIPLPLAIRTDDDPILRLTASPVAEEDFGGAVSQLVEAMVETVDGRGRGLAAPQIGVSLRVLVIKGPNRFIAMVNPTLERSLNRFAVEHEGCLSVPPRKWGNVSRPAKCDATWFDTDGEKQSATLTGDVARIFQHEFDHLNGVLMTDRFA